VLSGFFIVSGLMLFVVNRRRRTRSVGLAEPDLARLGRQLFHKVPSDVERSKTSDDHADRDSDFGALGKRADVKKLIEALHNQTPKRQK
jgi:hypothetical protein